MIGKEQMKKPEMIEEWKKERKINKCKNEIKNR